MTNMDFAKAMGKIDKSIIEQADNASVDNKHANYFRWHKWIVIAASFALVITLSIPFVYPNLIRGQETPQLPSIEIPTNGSQSSVNTNEATGEPEPDITNPSEILGVILDGKSYEYDDELSRSATEDNVGNAIGYVQDDHDTMPGLCIYEYLPNDLLTHRVIVSCDNTYYVYRFFQYIPDGTENWHANMLSNASQIRISTSSGYDNYAKFITDKSQVSNFLKFLTELLQSPTYSLDECEKHRYEKFKDHFNEGEIWFNEESDVVFPHVDVGSATWLILVDKYNELVLGNSCSIYAVIDDNTFIRYGYYEGSGEIYDQYGNRYILTESQIDQINHLLDLE